MQELEDKNYQVVFEPAFKGIYLPAAIYDSAPMKDFWEELKKNLLEKAKEEGKRGHELKCEEDKCFIDI